MPTIAIVNQQTAVAAADIPAAMAAIQTGLDTAFLPAYGRAGVQMALGPDPGGNAERIYVLNNTAQADVLGDHTLDSVRNPSSHLRHSAGFSFS